MLVSWDSRSCKQIPYICSVSWIKLSYKMDSVKRSAVTPSKSRLARTFAKVLHIQSVTGVSPDDGIKKTKSHEKIKTDPFRKSDEEDWDRAVMEAFIAKLFASISSIKAAYAHLQFSQSPYDGEGIQSADQIVISELKKLSELKQSFIKKQLNEPSPETTLLLSEIEEQKSLLKTYEITSKKLDSERKLKDSEITFCKEKLAEANRDNRSLEKKLNSSGQIAIPNDIKLSDLRPSHFITYFWQTLKSIRTFVRLLICEMESAEWDLDTAASSIVSGIFFWKPNHKCYVFESFVCKEMFDGFSNPNFSGLHEDRNRRLSFDHFLELKSVRPGDYLAWKPNSLFTSFCRGKYLKLMHPKMEASFFGDLNLRNSVNSGELPETPFFSAFSEMAKRVWLLHCLALSFDPEISIFHVSKGTRFSEVYMESLSDEAFGTMETDPRVAFTVVPGFRIAETIVQCQVYLC